MTASTPLTLTALCAPIKLSGLDGGVDPGFGLIDKWPENKQLGTWVGTQRKNAKKGTLSEEGRQRLEAVGFRF